MTRYLRILLLGICLLAPAAVKAEDRDHEGQRHEWNDREDQPWRNYLKEHHKKDHDWTKASKREQKAYWKWRDAHPEAPR
jgi:hypothetical protein